MKNLLVVTLVSFLILGAQFNAVAQGEKCKKVIAVNIVRSQHTGNVIGAVAHPQACQGTADNSIIYWGSSSIVMMCCDGLKGLEKSLQEKFPAQEFLPILIME